MKLLYCPRCSDVFNLRSRQWRVCLCRASGGQYNTDGVTATVGGVATVFGIANPFFNEFFALLTTDQRQAIRTKYKYDQWNSECWWGEFSGDTQIFRIESAAGPRLKIHITLVDALSNRIVVVDKRLYTIDGKLGGPAAHLEITVPALFPAPTQERQPQKSKGRLARLLKTMTAPEGHRE